MEKRSETNSFPDGMEQKDHILRLARGAEREGIPFKVFIAGLGNYVDDELLIDDQPLFGWWNMGGA